MEEVSMVHIRSTFLFVVSLLLVSACNEVQTQTVPPASVRVNSQVGPDLIVVTATPMTLSVVTNRTGTGSVELFDGNKSLGTVTTGVQRTDPENSYDFVLSVPVSASDNGVHSYTAVFYGKDSTGFAVKYTSQPTVATVQLK
jgi:hypothetical protein